MATQATPIPTQAVMEVATPPRITRTASLIPVSEEGGGGGGRGREGGGGGREGEGEGEGWM